MSHGRQHIADVSCPEMSSVVVMAIAEGNIAGAVAATGKPVDVIITFGDGAIYSYPNVPAFIAVAVMSDPESNFQTIRFWPGYHKVR